MRVTFGRYLPKNSIIHAMDPRFKLVMIILLMVSIFLPIGFTGYIICAVVILTIFALSKLSFRMLLGLLPPVLFVFFVIFLMNAFLTHPDSNILEYFLDKNNQVSGVWANKISGGAVTGQFLVSSSNLSSMPDGYQNIGLFYKIGPVWFSEKALYNALIMTFRIYLMISLTCILTASTSPLQLTLAIEDLLYPLKWIGIPVYILSMIISIALRMIPTLIDEAGRIMKAQSSRGIDVKNGKLKDKVKGLTSLIIPLLVSAFQKAEDLSYAMEARGYDPYSKRTRYIQFKFRAMDLVLLLFAFALMLFLILYSVNVLGLWHISFPRLDTIIGIRK
ncbi:Transmembrane component of general energizing module of ECF transporters [Mesoplasma florum W37]|uniref:Transmembrane component of general energizing module of ECF transporters n=1 Tax=Mesoplasma florum TaxID=2151 RepID=A0AAD0HSU2_MESFO|nr:energy-coupling factor transporter transmembrane component T [Mesoplasma florum]AGY41226.1 Transmembrane component of general energizing module of ECF transporters [Mesoplasma florum W37]AVN65564.1 Transmembrane component of general energizing module of ECF transporters [Mesoplasma florum]